MSVNISVSAKNQIIKSLVFDVIAILFAYFIPALSHISGLPLYFAEPMRLVIILSLVLTTRQNAYLLAFTLPFFSFIVSGHPVFIKTLVMSMELVINVFLFFLFSKFIKNSFFPIFFSIILSKIVYYLVKYFFVSQSLIEGSIISTPIVAQFITLITFSFVIYVFLHKKEK